MLETSQLVRETRIRRFVAAQMIGGRERQEDDFAILDLGDVNSERLVLVVADGMGGHPGAADAARLAIRSFCESVKTDTGRLACRLLPAVEHANREIGFAGVHDPAFKGAGCTLVAAAIEDMALSWISIGDSLLYLFRSGTICRLNARHVKTVNTGSGRMRNRIQVLRSAVTGKGIDLIDSSPQPLQLMPEDCIIVASDGLECISHRKMNSILRRSWDLRPAEVVDRLLRAVRTKPLATQDNTTIIFYRAMRGKRKTAALAGPAWHRIARNFVMLAVLAATCLYAAARWLLR